MHKGCIRDAFQDVPGEEIGCWIPWECLGIGRQELPTARLVIEPQGAMAKYRLETEVTEAGNAAIRTDTALRTAWSCGRSHGFLELHRMIPFAM